MAEACRIPRRATVRGELHLHDVSLAGPCGAVDRDLTGLQTGAIERTGDHRLHAESGDWVRIFGLHRFSRFPGLIGKAIAGTHEVAGELRFDDLDFREPLARCRANPT